MTTGLRASLGGGLGSGAGAAHRHLQIHRLEPECLAIPAELSPEEHSALLDGHRVVAVVLRGEQVALGTVRDQDASGTQTLSLHIGGREVLLSGDRSGKKEEKNPHQSGGTPAI